MRVHWAFCIAGRLATAAPSNSTTRACEEISAALHDRVSLPLSVPYLQESQAYWSVLLREQKPACVVFPTTAQDVSTAVTILNRYPDVAFAVKSGGHDPNAGHATAKDGVLIAMRDMVGATYDATRNVAYVKPGGEWNDVISSLARDGVTVAGGRLGLVGVGGLLTQGGLSFLSAQYGMAADNIVVWEIVAANGSIVNVDAKSHPDLAPALRGSGSQFGIVTKFTIKTHKIGKVWGGVRMYDASKEDQIFGALHNFVPDNNADPKAAIILTDIFVLGGIETFLIFYFYDGELPPTTGPFADLLKIGFLYDQTSTQDYADLLKSNGATVSIVNARISFRTFTIPYIPNNPGIYAEISKKLASLTALNIEEPLNVVSQCSVDFQPLPSIIGKHSRRNGGNAMGLAGTDGHRIILEIQCAWASAVNDKAMEDISRGLTTWLETKVPEWLRGKGASGERYLPFFMNDAMGDQNVTGSYRDYRKFKLLQSWADPNRVLSSRVGGFKY